MPVAEWFKRLGVKVVLVPTTQSADLREHPSAGPAEPLRRAVKLRSSIIKRRAAVFARIDALLEVLGPGWYEELSADFGNASLPLLARYANPHDLLLLGPARLSRFLIRYSHGQWRHAKADALLQVARDSLA